MANNISVAFHAFALGISAGLGTCYVLLVNAMMLGGFAGHFANHGLSYPLWSFLAPHGVLEIFAILVSAAAGLRLGLSLAVPGRLTRRASLRIGAREAVLLFENTAGVEYRGFSSKGSPFFAPIGSGLFGKEGGNGVG